MTPDYGTASSPGHGISEAPSPFADLHVAMGFMAVNQLPVCLLMLAAIPAGPVASHAAAAAALLPFQVQVVSLGLGRTSDTGAS